MRIFQYFDPFERIALDYQKIGQRTLFDNAEIAGIRVACAGKRQQTGVVASNHSENFEIGEPLLQLDDPVILIFRIGGIEQQVGFPKPILRRVFWRGGMSDPFRCRFAGVWLAGRRRIGVVLDGEGLHTEPCAAFGQQGHRGLVDQGARVRYFAHRLSGPGRSPAGCSQ